MAGEAVELDRRLLCQTPARQHASEMAVGGFGGVAFELTLVHVRKPVLERVSKNERRRIGLVEEVAATNMN